VKGARAGEEEAGISNIPAPDLREETTLAAGRIDRRAEVEPWETGRHRESCVSGEPVQLCLAERARRLRVAVVDEDLIVGVLKPLGGAETHRDPFRHPTEEGGADNRRLGLGQQRRGLQHICGRRWGIRWSGGRRYCPALGRVYGLSRRRREALEWRRLWQHDWRSSRYLNDRWLPFLLLDGWLFYSGIAAAHPERLIDAPALQALPEGRPHLLRPGLQELVQDLLELPNLLRMQGQQHPKGGPHAPVAPLPSRPQRPIDPQPKVDSIPTNMARPSVDQPIDRVDSGHSALPPELLQVRGVFH
jgi:hypothetical protein